MLSVGQLFQMGIGTEQRRLKQHPFITIKLFGKGRITEVNAITASPTFHDRHLILGQGTGFIGTDHRGTSQCFHRRQGTHDRVQLHQTLYTNSQHNGRDNL
ncbi:hypothetical protein SDC9_206534 [bioreactor metagenome]|uniref:Uncharacterized protein n=1 Tax=bioreactor metagenome TaxID=1076179 RepID=A0A645J800_9ZZZZ